MDGASSVSALFTVSGAGGSGTGLVVVELLRQEKKVNNKENANAKNVILIIFIKTKVALKYQKILIQSSLCSPPNGINAAALVFQKRT